MKIPTLMYHDVVLPTHADASGFPGGAAARYKLDVTEFDQHLTALAASGLSFGSVVDGATARPERCLLTFDDGGISALAVAAALTRRGMIGHFFITTARIGQPGFVNASDLQTLRSAGHIVGSHSHTHPAEISKLDDRALTSEWLTSVGHLNALLGMPVTVASVPGGFYSSRVARAAAAAGIRYLFTSEPTVHTQWVDDCLVLGRYTLWHGMPSQRAMALATGEGTARQRQWVSWNIKKPLKRWARPVYHWVRSGLLDMDPPRNDV